MDPPFPLYPHSATQPAQTSTCQPSAVREWGPQGRGGKDTVPPSKAPEGCWQHHPWGYDEQDNGNTVKASSCDMRVEEKRC